MVKVGETKRVKNGILTSGLFDTDLNIVIRSGSYTTEDVDSLILHLIEWKLSALYKRLLPIPA
mgnify:CR=1 FL=1